MVLGAALLVVAWTEPPGPTNSAASTAETTTTTTAATTTSIQRPTEPAIVDVPVAVVRHTADAATEGFEAFVRRVLEDPRGWERAGFDFTFGEGAPYTVVLAEGAEVDALCAPYDVGGRFSCQLGPVVALNADRWRTATDAWPASLDDYRTMLVNHEVGHLIGRHHPTRVCEAPGAPAAVMAPQSGGLEGCTANPWPLPWEIACAARHDEPVAPGYEEDPRPTCGPADG